MKIYHQKPRSKQIKIRFTRLEFLKKELLRRNSKTTWENFFSASLCVRMPEVYLGPYQTSMVKLYFENSKRLWALNYFHKNHIVDAWKDPEYLFELVKGIVIDLLINKKRVIHSMVSTNISKVFRNPYKNSLDWMKTHIFSKFKVYWPSRTFRSFFKSHAVLTNRLNLFIYKQRVYKQLTLGWQIAKQLSGLNSFSLLSNSKNYRLKKTGTFPLQ